MKKVENLNVKFELSNEEYINPQFTKGRCKIAYIGKNRNGSSISKEVFEKALPSLKNIPVVGYYDEETGKFTSHIGKMEMKDGEFKIYYPTPVGVVPESCNAKWETVFEEDGKINEYLSCDVLLWTGRWSEILEAYKNGDGFRQSMEIEVKHWSDIDGGTLRIEELIFSSLCILQSAEPCFESSNIELFTLNKDKFKQEFSLLLDEIKNIDKEGDRVPTEKEIEVVQDIETTEEITDTIAENEVNEETVGNVDEVVEVEDTTVETEEFNQEEPQVNEDIQEEVVETIEDEKVEEIIDEVVDNETENKEEVEINPCEIKKEVEEILDSENEFNVLETEEYKELLDKFNKLNEELIAIKEEKLELEKSNNELYSFKEDILEKERINKINSIEAQFSKKLDINEVKSIKDRTINKEMSVEEMENELCKMFTKKSFEVESEIERPAIQQIFSIKEENKCPYPGLEHLFS